MNSNIVDDLGLTPNEAKIYSFLLKNGEQTTGPIIKETNIVNSRVYESLNSLIAKGLISFNKQKNGKHFRAENPQRLVEIEEEKLSKIKSMIPMLSALQVSQGEKTESAVYEGFEGFKTAFKKIIDDCPVGGTIKILGFSSQNYANDSLRIFMKNMNLKCVAKKQKLKLILGEEDKKTLGKDREFEKISEVRYMPKGYVSPAAMDIFGDYVYIMVWDKVPTVFMIKNKGVAKSFEQYFDYLWMTGKK